MIRRPPRSTLSSSSAASDVYKRQKVDTAPSGDMPAGVWNDTYAEVPKGSMPAGDRNDTFAHARTPGVGNANVNDTPMILGVDHMKFNFASPAPGVGHPVGPTMAPGLGQPGGPQAPTATDADSSIQDISMSKVNTRALGPQDQDCLLYTSPSPRDATLSRMPSSA